jgi:hypothetical protein
MMQRTKPQPRDDLPFFSRERPSDGELDHQAGRERKRRPAPSQFDLVVTFENDQHARDALLALRRRGFGPDSAVLLTRGPMAQDEFELAVDELRAESYVAFAIVVATELVLGTLLGAIVGWLAGLFHFAPEIGPVWQPILIVGGVGFLCALVVAFFEFRRWRRDHLPSPAEAAVALRLRGRDAPDLLVRAQDVLTQFGGQREAG